MVTSSISIYEDNTKNDDEALKEAMMTNVFKRVYGAKGSIERNGALGLVQWLEKNKSQKAG